jgi:tetratricopeptide (TPR) repeat protein
MRTGVRSALLVILLSLAAPVAAQEPPDALSQWIEAHARAVRLYGRGERDAAISAIAERPLPDQRRVVQQVLKLLEARARGEQVKTLWTLDDAATAGALHMDAALSAYRRADRTSMNDLAEHIKLGEAFFGFRRSGDEEAHRAPRWELAIGLTALADGRFGVAATILDAGCAKYPRFAPLQLACGSAHESMAMFAANPAYQPLDARDADRGRPRVATYYDDRPFAVHVHETPSLARAKAIRSTEISTARRALERAIRLDAHDAEAHIRVAHLDILEGKDTAASRLAPIVARTDLDARLGYLARLFLGDLHARLGRIDDARVMLEAAIAIVPSGQSAHIALARAVRTSGDHDQASALLHRMMNAPIKPDDPMIGYRFGQYWVPDPLIDTLRAEALRR